MRSKCFLGGAVAVLLTVCWSRGTCEDLGKNYGRFFTDGPTNKRSVALTFDDGPSASTPKVLDLLKKAGVKATFFMMGAQARKYPQFAKQVAEQGHLIGNHSFDHPNFYFYKKDDKAEKLTEEIRSARDSIRKATGVDTVFMRMPHGYVRPWVKEIAKRERIILVNWTYGSDWTHLSREKMLEGYLSRLRPGSILLFHDGEGDRSKTLWVLPKVLEALKKKNLTPVRIDELLASQLQ